MSEINDYNTLTIDYMGKGDAFSVTCEKDLNIRNATTVPIKVVNLDNNSEIILNPNSNRVYQSVWQQHFNIISTELCNGNIDQPPPPPKLYQDNKIKFVGTTEDKLESVRLRNLDGTYYTYAFASKANFTNVYLATGEHYSLTGNRTINTTRLGYVMTASGTATPDNNGQIAVRYEAPILDTSPYIEFVHKIIMGGLPEITFGNDNDFAINIIQRDPDTSDVVATIPLAPRETKTIPFVTSIVQVRKQ